MAKKIGKSWFLELVPFPLLKWGTILVLLAVNALFGLIIFLVGMVMSPRQTRLAAKEFWSMLRDQFD
jgi:hypothetical protein